MTNRWMATLPSYVKARPINHIIVPGTHDSCAFTVNLSIPVSEPLKENLRKYIGPIRPSFITKWAITQDYNVYEQLALGVRYIDIRISYMDGILYTSHSYACVPLENILYQIYEFSKNNMSEIVYLDFYKDVYLERKNYDEFGRMIEQHPLYELCYDGSTPVTIDTPAIPSYDSLIKLQKNIIIMIETNDRNIPTAKDHPIKKQMSAYRFKESNKSDVIEVGKAKTIERLKTMNPNLINIHEEILTPEDETVYIDLLRQGGFVVLFLTEFLLIVRMINNSRCIKKYVACCVIIVLILILLIYQTHNSITSLRSASDLTYNVIVTILRSKIDYINRTTIVTGDFVDSRFINNVISLNYML